MGHPLRLLHVEDSEDDALLVLRELRRSGYDVACQRVETAAALKNALAQEPWDVIISDYNMPNFSGTEALQLLKQSGLDVPLIYVSGAIGEDTAVAIMKAGAHDYIMKGNLKRLAPAIARELREAEQRTERRRAEEQLQFLAYHDPVTRLPNYAMFQKRLEQAVSNEESEKNRFAVLILRVHHFNEINNALGYDASDVLLDQIGQRLRVLLPEYDLLACLRANEFGVFAPQIVDAAVAIRLAQTLLSALEESFTLDGFKLGIQASFGIAMFPDHGNNCASLIQRGRTALIAARKAFRGYAVYSPDHDQGAPQHLALLGELRKAIINNELFLHYQPKVDLANQTVPGLEALVRWKHPEAGIISPDRFIPLAEQTGLIMPLSLWVLNEALRQCKTWNEQGLPLKVAVNLSAVNLDSEGLFEQIKGLLQSTAVSPSQVELEVTETAIMASPQRAMEQIGRLKEMGLRISIDDFGIGYSSLAYLKKLPVDTIKIDKAFVMNMVTDQEDCVIVRSIINLAHSLGLKVVAEGVENRKIMELLKQLGCDEGQGYYFSKPFPPQELSARLVDLQALLADVSRPSQSSFSI